MRAVIHDFYTEIFQTNDEVKTLCRPGSGADTCSWLVAGVNGFECVCLNKPLSLAERHARGEMVAMRDGCDKVNSFVPSAQLETEVDF